MGERLRYEVLNVIEFTSARKRMSLIVKTPDGKIKVFCKGADSVIYERLCPAPVDNSDPEQSSLDDFRDATLEHLEAFATDGLRTLCFAVADIPDSFYQVHIIHSRAAVSRLIFNGRIITWSNIFFLTVVARDLP